MEDHIPGTIRSVCMPGREMEGGPAGYGKRGDERVEGEGNMVDNSMQKEAK